MSAPGGGATLCLTFDNLGEAAEIGVGALRPDDPRVGSHPTATEVLPRVLDLLDVADLPATFFVEGLNAELYPELLGEIDARGHEVAYHAWTHEQWADLEAAERATNLSRGIEAMGAIGIEVSGLRPPGGGLGADGAEIARRAGLAYASPAGKGAGIEGGLALLPFQWRHVDVACTLPQLAGAREQMVGSEEPIAPEPYVEFLEEELAALVESGGFLAFVFHPFMLEWLGEGHLATLLDRIAAASAHGGLRVKTCRAVAAEVLERPTEFAGATRLDSTSWAD